PAHQALRLVGSPLHELADLLVGLGEARQDVAGDDLGIARVGPPNPGPNPPEVRPADALRKALEAVVAGEAAAQAGANLAERQVDLVVDDDEPPQRHLHGTP